ncbi:nitroreductase family protein [Fusobacterium gonidiaformans 3-1-5R]|uniref:Nitroreductase family protein n=1 Tax=Fusobacterium gonidiaformans 3-1-5R TaxID=469605 RepID=E5BGW2_9FUSO|nr:nitroreductase family protein [Fusobacterium gonidiaformans]EFS21735.1 nitroreductase family protein [Fusobacterium gonidiaformans 3-1-5R]
MLEKIKKNRSHRSFEQVNIPTEDLHRILTAVSYSASARNAQENRFMFTNSFKQCKQIFKQTKWAGAISWNPTEEEGPTAYILLCNPSEKPTAMSFVDMGIALQSMTLVAQDLGYSCCILGAYNKKEVEKIFGLPDGYFSFLLLAIGKATDTVEVVITHDLSVKYQREEENHHTVFKLPMEDVLLTNIDENN